jgi:hypothetical protein
MKVDVYRNLNKECWSVRSRETDNYGKVVDHTDTIIVVDAEFVVQPAGLKRTRETGVKNVHAFVRGIKESQQDYSDLLDEWGEPIYNVTYDPFKKDHFYLRGSGKKIESSPLVYMSIDNGVFVQQWNTE